MKTFGGHQLIKPDDVRWRPFSLIIFIRELLIRV